MMDTIGCEIHTTKGMGTGLGRVADTDKGISLCSVVILLFKEYIMLTFSDYAMLIGLLSFCGFITYTFSQVQQAILSYLDEYPYRKG
jgi:hypothetical protein